MPGKQARTSWVQAHIRTLEHQGQREGGSREGERERRGGMIKSEAQRQNKFQKANVAACCSKDDSGLRLADITRLWRGD